jgi:hypothetical protein
MIGLSIQSEAPVKAITIQNAYMEIATDSCVPEFFQHHLNTSKCYDVLLMLDSCKTAP